MEHRGGDRHERNVSGRSGVQPGHWFMDDDVGEEHGEHVRGCDGVQPEH